MQYLVVIQELVSNILKNFPFYLNTAIELVGALVLVATVITKATPSPKDDAALEGFKLKFHAFLAWLPTFGYNPHQDVINEAEEKKEGA
jgi:hypothetical protein